MSKTQKWLQLPESWVLNQVIQENLTNRAHIKTSAEIEPGLEQKLYSVSFQASPQLNMLR